MWGAVAKGIGGAIVGEVAVALALDTSLFDKGVNNSVKSAEKTYGSAFNGIGNAGTQMFSKLTKAAVTFVSIGALVKFGKQALQLGSDLQEVQNVVDVTFGSMSGAVDDYAKTAIETAGLSETVAKKYMGTFGAMNNQFGFTTEQSYEMSKAITQLTGDVASFYNLSSDEAYTKLKSIWTGETETLKEIGVVMTQNALDQYALANGYGKTTAKMTEQEKVALRYAFVQDKLSLASGDFVRTQNGWANQTRVLTLRWQQFMATVGQGLINVLTPLVQMLNVLMSKLQSFANAFKNFTSSLFGDANAGSGGGVSSTITDINNGLGNIGSTATDSADSVSKASKEIKRSLAGVDELNILNSNKDSGTGSGSGGISDAVLDASGIGNGLSTDMSGIADSNSGALSKLADKVKELIKPLQEIDFTNLKNGLDKVKESLEPITKKLGEGLEWLWYNVLVPITGWVIEDAVPSFLNAIAGALDLFNGVMDFAKPYLQFLWEEFLQPIASWTGGVIVDVLDWIGDGLSKIGDWLSEHAPTIEDVKDDLGPFNKLLEEFGKAWKTIMGLQWDWFTTKLEVLWNYVLKPIWEYLLKPLFTQYWGKLSGLASIIGGIFEAFNKLMEGDWKGAGESIITGLEEGIKKIWDTSLIKKWFYDPIVGGFKKLFGINSPSTVFIELGGWLLQGLSNGLGNLFTWATEKFNAIIDGFSGIYEKALEIGTNLKNGIVDGLGNIKEWASGKLEDIKSGFSTAKEKLKNTGQNIKNGITEGLGNIKSWASGKLEDIKNGFSTAKSKLTSAGQSIKSGLTTGMGNLKSWASGKLTEIKDGFSTAKTKGSEIGSNIWSGLKSSFSNKKLGLNVKYDTNVGSVKTAVYKALGLSGWPKLSFLAQGGWVAANNPQLAVVGDNKREPEIIAPESKIRNQVKQAINEMGGTGKTQQIEITIYHKYEDGRTIIQKVNQAQIDAGEVLLLT